MSRPRAATSVAMRRGTCPLLNFSMAAERTSCERSPWIASTVKPPLCTVPSTLSASFLYSTKISTRFFPVWCFFSSSKRRLSFACPSTTSTTCLTRWLADNSSEPTVTRAGSERNSEAMPWMLIGHVAENMRVCLCFAHCEMILRMSFSNPRSNMRSASSSTRYDTEDTSMEPSSMKSSRRPGVATTTCTPPRSWFRCSPLATPP
mmetsp:Transcript_41982/g.84479  ORF Transcript_41982/g.84479 Transcript_41982/m.84479 type:complete len:205 (-) Transcript_41982:345-959(-)